jgi:hypothetical protein
VAGVFPVLLKYRQKQRVAVLFFRINGKVERISTFLTS